MMQLNYTLVYNVSNAPLMHIASSEVYFYVDITRMQEQVKLSQAHLNNVG